MKTKLGVSVGLLGAMVYFGALFGGYIPLILLAGYILLFEENEWLRRSAVKAAALMVSISLLLALIGLVPDLLSWIGSFVALFQGFFNYSTVTLVLSIITKAIDIVRTVLFLVLGVKALNQGSIDVPFVDAIINKYF